MSNIDKFRSTVTVLDTETTNLIPEQCEIVEIAAAKWHDGRWLSNGMLLGAYHGIPPEASAKNNISNRMIEGKPKFDQNIKNVKNILGWTDARYFVAHNAAYDRASLVAAFTRMHGGSDIKLVTDDSRWLCTWRLSKQILSHGFNDVQYGLGYLRYYLDLDVPDDIGVHRADADALVCAKLLDRLVELAISNGQIDPGLDIGEQLNRLCWTHIETKIWPFGKHKGRLLSDLDNDYYAWALKNLPQLQEDGSSYDPDLSESVRRLLEKRLLEL